jgi:hypothetical protein
MTPLPPTFRYLNRLWRLRSPTMNGGIYSHSGGEERHFDHDWIRRNVAQD